MAPTARPRLGLLLLLLLPPPGPVRGNEGGAAGSCQCEKHPTPPALLTRHSDKLESCDTCRDFIRFHFPRRKVCGLKQEAWVVHYKHSLCHKAGSTWGKSQETPGAAGSSTEVAGGPTRAGSTSEPKAEAAVKGGTQFPLEEKSMPPPPAPDTKTPTIVLLGVALLSVGCAVSVLCWWRRQHRWAQGGRAPQTLPGEEEGTLCLPGDET